MESLQQFKRAWAHEHEPAKELIDAVNVSSEWLTKSKELELSSLLCFLLFQAIKPTVLIGTSGVGRAFTQEVVEAMASLNEVQSC